MTTMGIPWTPHAGQRKGVKFLVEHAAAGLFFDPGVGKTSTTLAAFSYLKKKGVANKMLLIAPLRPCYKVWPDEIKKWRDFNHLKFTILHGPAKDRNLAGDYDVYIINPEGLDWLLEATKMVSATGRTKMEVDVARFKKLGFDTLVIDELSKFKHSTSNRFKAMKSVIGTFARRWGLTGSPSANGLVDLFGECYMLDQGRSLGQYITHFKTTYFETGYDGFSLHLKANAEKQIYERIAPLVIRGAAEDYVDMPELVENRIEIELPPKVRRQYDQLEEELITKIDLETITAANAGAASIKCRQLIAGGLYHEDHVVESEDGTSAKTSKKTWSNVHMLKAEAVKDLVEELQGSPLLVAYDFKHDLDRLRKVFGEDVPYIGGGVSAKRGAELEDQWNAGKLPILIGHPASIGHGLNLQKCGQHVCWHTMTWDYELYDQFIRRVWRQGNKSARVFVHHIMAKDTLDTDMFYRLKHKARGQQALFDALAGIKQRRGR